MKITEEFCKENGFKKELFDPINGEEGYYYELELCTATHETALAITWEDDGLCFLSPYDKVRFSTQEQVLKFIQAFPKCEHKNISRKDNECLDCFETVK